MGETTNEYRMLTENTSVTGMIVKKWILKNQNWKVQIRFNFAQGWNQWWASVNIMKLGIP